MRTALSCLLAACGLLLVRPTAAQTYTYADLHALLSRPHTVTTYEILNPGDYAALTGLGGGPGIFDLRGAHLAADTTVAFTPVTCSSAIPGCAESHLSGASLVLQTAATEGPAYAFYDFTLSGLALRGGAGSYFDEEAQVSREVLTMFSPPAQALALPLQMGTAWTAEYDVRLSVDAQAFVVAHDRDAFDVRGWGTLQTDLGTTTALLLVERSISTSLLGVPTTDTTYTYQFFSPTLSATLETDSDGVVTFGSIEVVAPGTGTPVEPDAPRAEARLEAVQPNPSQGYAEVRFTLGTAQPVRLDVYDLLGRRVATLADEVLPAGAHVRTWAAEAPAGLYQVRLQAGPDVSTRSLTRID